MTTPQIVIFDAITGQTVTRDYDKTELLQLEADIAQAEKDAAAQAKADQALADKRQIILDRLGLTTDEFKTLIS